MDPGASRPPSSGRRAAVAVVAEHAVVKDVEDRLVHHPTDHQLQATAFAGERRDRAPEPPRLSHRCTTFAAAAHQSTTVANARL